MRNFLNTLAHFLVSFSNKNVEVSDKEANAYLLRAEQVKQEVLKWAGSGQSEKISIGQNCSTAWYLKASGNKTASYPFDWVGTSAEIIEDCLRDDFKKYCNEDLFISKFFHCGHKSYHADFFGHRNPKRSAKDRAYFKRSAERLMAAMQNEKPIIFVCTVLNEFEKRPLWTNGFTQDFAMPRDQDLSHFQSLINYILSVKPNCKFLFIEEYTQGKFDFSVRHKTNNVLWLKYTAIGKSTGVKYLNLIDDDVMKVVYQGLRCT